MLPFAGYYSDELTWQLKLKHWINFCLSDSSVVTIASFAPQFVVITSKQRPRKLTIHGSDGEDYTFLLKGHEDLRQDERVMQVWFPIAEASLWKFDDVLVPPHKSYISSFLDLSTHCWWIQGRHPRKICQFNDILWFLCHLIVVWLNGFHIVTLYTSWSVNTEMQERLVEWVYLSYFSCSQNLCLGINEIPNCLPYSVHAQSRA